MAELAQRLRFDLANPLAGHTETLTHLFQGALVTVDEAEAQLQHAPLARRERIQDVLDLVVEHGQRGGIRRRGRLPVLDEIAEEMGITPEKVREIIKVSQDPVSLETPIGEEEDSHLGDFVEDKEATA